MHELGNVYVPDEWKLFIEFIKVSLKAVLLYSGKKTLLSS